jgi:hypothetical protein
MVNKWRAINAEVFPSQFSGIIHEGIDLRRLNRLMIFFDSCDEWKQKTKKSDDPSAQAAAAEV